MYEYIIFAKTYLLCIGKIKCLIITYDFKLYSVVVNEKLVIRLLTVASFSVALDGHLYVLSISD